MEETTTKQRKFRKNQKRVSVPDEIFPRLKETAQQEGRPMNQVIAEALNDYFAKKENS